MARHFILLGFVLAIVGFAGASFALLAEIRISSDAARTPDSAPSREAESRSKAGARDFELEEVVISG